MNLDICYNGKKIDRCTMETLDNAISDTVKYVWDHNKGRLGTYTFQTDKSVIVAIVAIQEVYSVSSGRCSVVRFDKGPVPETTCFVVSYLKDDAVSEVVKLN